MLAWLALVIAVLISALVFLPGDAAGMDSIPGLTVAASVLALLISLYVAASSRSNGHGRSIQMVVALLVAGLAVAAYMLKDNDTLAALLPKSPDLVEAPATGAERGPAAVLIRRDDAGKFIAHGAINGVATDLLLDTGATAVMLRHSDAEKAGVAMTGLNFNTPVETANGTVYAASIRLRAIAIGAVHAEDVEALVVPAGSLNESLLGMSFLRRLRSYDLKGDFLTLRQ